MKGIYTLAIYVYQLIIHIASFFNPKALLWLRGRKDWLAINKQKIADWPIDEPRVWVHCASLGEFEQGRPLIEKIKLAKPKTKIILTFFSPSGYEIRKDYLQADLIMYLPLDTPRNAKLFLDLNQPHIAVFVKYEFWFNYLLALQKRKIPLFLIAGLFRPKQHFFKFYGAWFRKVLSGFTHFFLQDRSSAALLAKIDIHQFQIAGDPRIDRVLDLANNVTIFPEIEHIIKDKKVLIIGSSWPPDEAIIIPFLNTKLPEDWVAIIAPHEIGSTHIQQIEKALNIPYIKYSSLKSGNHTRLPRVLIVDNIGMLSALYQYGKIAYIGGGFGNGIHNTLEPIAFGLPVLFGPKYHKFEEAKHLIAYKGGFCVSNLNDFIDHFETLQIGDNYQKSVKAARAYVEDNKGATELIFQHLLNYLPE